MFFKKKRITLIAQFCPSGSELDTSADVWCLGAGKVRQPEELTQKRMASCSDVKLQFMTANVLVCRLDNPGTIWHCKAANVDLKFAAWKFTVC